MSDSVQIDISYDDPEFFEALKDPDGLLPYLGDAMENILSVYQTVAEEYAPESEANRPGRFNMETKEPMGYYERGRGWWYPLITHITLGGEDLPTVKPHKKSPKTMKSMRLLAVGFKGVAGYKLVPSSEQMHDRWEIGVGITSREVVGHLRNTASYSDLVQGSEQMGLHASRGWITVMTSWEDREVQDAVYSETAKALEKYYNIKGS